MGKMLKILIVEDERIVAEDLRRILQKFGYNVSAVVSSGNAALEKTGELKPDLVLMDIMLRGRMSGIEAAEQIRSTFNIPVIYITGFADEKTLEWANKMEHNGFILKPFEEKELQSTIEHALSK